MFKIVEIEIFVKIEITYKIFYNNFISYYLFLFASIINIYHLQLVSSMVVKNFVTLYLLLEETLKHLLTFFSLPFLHIFTLSNIEFSYNHKFQLLRRIKEENLNFTQFLKSIQDCETHTNFLLFCYILFVFSICQKTLLSILFQFI